MEHSTDEQGMRVTVGDANIYAGQSVSGVTVVKETIGVIFLGILALILLAALLRAQARNRELLQQLAHP
jgi:hypothetical protein